MTSLFIGRCPMLEYIAPLGLLVVKAPKGRYILGYGNVISCDVKHHFPIQALNSPAFSLLTSTSLLSGLGFSCRLSLPPK